MPKYLVNVREVHIQPYLVEAKDADEARQIAAEVGVPQDSGFEYSHSLEPEYSTVEELVWTDEDEKLSRKQGWELMLIGGIYTIEASISPTRVFSRDEDAECHVLQRISSDHTCWKAYTLTQNQAGDDNENS